MKNYKIISSILLCVAFGWFAIPPLHAEDDHENHDHEPPAAAEKDEHAHADDESGDEHGDDEHGDDHAAEQVTIPAQALETFGIRAEPVKKQVLSDVIVAPGRVTFNAERMAHVGSAVSGRVVEINAAAGDDVGKGDVLLIVDSPELGEAQSDLLVKRAEVAGAEAGAEAAASAYERAKQLYDESKGIALAEVQKRQAENQSARATLLGAQAAATAAENKLHLLGMDHQAMSELEKTGEIDPRYRVLAPLDGQVIEREATLGELVGPDREALLVLANLQTFWVLADVPETKLSQVKPGTAARIGVAAQGGAGIEGKVSHISPQLDPATRTGQVRIEVSDGQIPLRSGMFARVELQPAASADSAVLAVPDQAIQMVEGQNVVFVASPEQAGTFVKRPVTTAPPVGQMTPILDGLREGESVVVEGSFLLKAEHEKSSAGHQH